MFHPFFLGFLCCASSSGWFFCLERVFASDITLTAKWSSLSQVKGIIYESSCQVRSRENLNFPDSEKGARELVSITRPWNWADVNVGALSNPKRSVSSFLTVSPTLCYPCLCTCAASLSPLSFLSEGVLISTVPVRSRVEAGLEPQSALLYSSSLLPINLSFMMRQQLVNNSTLQHSGSPALKATHHAL